MSPLRDAASFLTRVSLPGSTGSVVKVGEAVPWFAVVGVVLGLVQGVIYVGLDQVVASTAAAAISAAVLGQITGAFHRDGIAGVADSFGGPRYPDDPLRARPGSRPGTYGFIALMFVIIVEIAALASLAGWLAVAATVSAHTISRAVAGFMMIIARPARTEGPALDYLAGLSRSSVIGVSLLVAAGAVVLFGVTALPLIFAGYGAGALIVRVAIARFGGLTADVLGAIQQVTTIVTLVIIVCADELTTDPGLLGGLALR